ncbi:MAG: hypothetical protein J6P66_00615 [Bacteroidaceae bacterium]|nr:hypothetical protein [Bacteroidaceae bacterium]
MEQWKKRLINEEKELAYKIRKLTLFLNGDDVKDTSNLSTQELLLMIDQLNVMKRYDEILRLRMEQHHLIVEVKLDGR